jgi:hypothetical protein
MWLGSRRSEASEEEVSEDTMARSFGFGMARQQSTLAACARAQTREWSLKGTFLPLFVHGGLPIQRCNLSGCTGSHANEANDQFRLSYCGLTPSEDKYGVTALRLSV